MIQLPDFLLNLFQTDTAAKIFVHYLLSSQISLTYVIVKDSYLMSAMQEGKVLETVVPSIAVNAIKDDEEVIDDDDDDENENDNDDDDAGDAADADDDEDDNDNDKEEEEYEDMFWGSAVKSCACSLPVANYRNKKSKADFSVDYRPISRHISCKA